MGVSFFSRLQKINLRRALKSNKLPGKLSFLGFVMIMVPGNFGAAASSALGYAQRAVEQAQAGDWNTTVEVVKDFWGRFPAHRDTLFAGLVEQANQAPPKSPFSKILRLRRDLINQGVREDELDKLPLAEPLSLLVESCVANPNLAQQHQISSMSPRLHADLINILAKSYYLTTVARYFEGFPDLDNSQIILLTKDSVSEALEHWPDCFNEFVNLRRTYGLEESP